jgi:CIC family chloride channel protein
LPPGERHLAVVRHRRPSERVRQPQPLLKRRVPSGRGATEQPNVTSDSDAALSLRLWLLLVATGVLTGLFGALMMLLLFSVEHATFGYVTGSFESGVSHTSDIRRVVALTVAGVLAGVGWWVIRRVFAGEVSEVDESIWAGDGRLSMRRCLASGTLSEVVIGMGASMGRENAPKLLGGAAGSILAGRGGLNVAQRRLLVACGAGAGFAAVYNVPLAGALFTAEVLIGSVTLPVVLPALACSGVATLVSWVYLPDHATYLGLPDYRFRTTLMVWALLAGPVIGVVAVVWIRVIGWISHHRPRGVAAIFAPIGAFALLGVISIQYPQLLGNGKDLAHDAFIGAASLATFAALFALKPFVTALCLGSGASGGLFTPTLSTGAAFGAFTGMAWSHLWPGSGVGAFAMVGAAAMMGAGIQAPLSGIALVLELTHTDFAIMVPMIVATLLATIVARHLDGYSIYSARLPALSSGHPVNTRHLPAG